MPTVTNDACGPAFSLVNSVLTYSLLDLLQSTFQGATAATINKGLNHDGAAAMDDIELGEKAPATGAIADGSMRLNFITGTIPSERLNGFER